MEQYLFSIWELLIYCSGNIFLVNENKIEELDLAFAAGIGVTEKRFIEKRFVLLVVNEKRDLALRL